MVTGVMLSILILPSVSSLAYAQYIPSSGQTGLDDYLDLAKKRVQMASENPHVVSGTPMFALNGVVGALVLSTGVFGGIATSFFVRGCQGKICRNGKRMKTASFHFYFVF